MHRTSFLFGLGVGIMAVAALCWFAYGIQSGATERAHKRALMALTGAAASQPDAQPGETPAPPQPLTDADITARAKELGMGFAADFTPAPTPQPTPSGPVDIAITIVEGTGSRQIANLLEGAGVVMDAAAFDDYMAERGVTRVMPYGVFEFHEQDMPYAKALDILRRRNR